MVTKTSQKSEILDRQPPRDLDAEKAVLGSVLMKSDLLDDLVGVVSSKDFYDDANSEIFEKMVAIHETGKKLDMRLLTDGLRRSGAHDRVGGAGYLAELTRAVPVASNCLHYAGIVRDYATQRAMIEAATVMLRDAYEPKIKVDEELALLERVIEEERRRQGIGQPRSERSPV